MKRTETFAGLREFKRQGYYFELVSSTFPVDVTFYDANDVVLEQWSAAVAGDIHNRRLPAADGKSLSPFSRVELTANGLGDTITFRITDGLSTTRSVSADVSDRGSRQLGTLSGAAYTEASFAAGAAAANALAASGTRRYLRINIPAAAVGKIYVRCDGNAATADANSLELAPGQTWEPNVPPTGAVSVISPGGAQNINVAHAD